MQLSGLDRLVLIGASAGGPGQIQDIITALPKMQKSSLIIAPHMVEAFIPSFAKRLQQHSTNPIELTDANKGIDTGHIYICNADSKVIMHDDRLQFMQSISQRHTYNPNIDLLFSSILPFADELDLLIVILTGIGEDGVKGCKMLCEHGARCLTESAESAIVDGMPSRARESVPGIEVMHKKHILDAIVKFSY